MKKLFIVLALASMFIATTSFGALMHKSSQAIPPAGFGAFDFDLNYDGNTNMITIGPAINQNASSIIRGGAWGTNSFSFAVSAPDANGIVTSPILTSFPFGAGALITFTGSASIGTFTLKIFNWFYDTDGGDPTENKFALAPYWNPPHIPVAVGDGRGFNYAPAVPIPGAAWLLLSGLVGLIALRRKS